VADRASGESAESAIVVRVGLPAALERLRRRCVADATRGMPAHVTLSYPFIPPVELTREHRSVIAEIGRAHDAFDYRLRGPARWPDTVYASVDPVEPFLAIHRRLAAAFPDYPIYGRPAGFILVPHVTIAEGPFVDDPSVEADAAWTSLPVRRTAKALEVITSNDRVRWRLVWRVPFGATVAHYNPSR
jgi:hypothetical protein